MTSHYTDAGDDKKTHIHRLIMLYKGIPDQFGNRYRCYTCHARLKNRSGVVIGTEVMQGDRVLVVKAGHILKIDCLHDAQAHCSCGGWEFMRTGAATEAEIVEMFHSHSHLAPYKNGRRSA